MLLTKDNIVKLGDLGLAKNLADTLGRTYAGTPVYMSPEQSSGSYDFKADIWFDYILFSLIIN